MALANKQEHVPFRNSKLTYLLQPCLGGDSKTLMFLNVAPTREFAHESLCSLRFGAKVNACEINVPKKNVVVPRG
jgi:kinesin family protein C1